jgi:hypothetical protein
MLGSGVQRQTCLLKHPRRLQDQLSACPPDLVQAWGKCDSAWMVGGGFCKRTCGRCGGGDQRVQLKKANAPVTLEKVTAGSSAPATVKTMSGAKVCVFVLLMVLLQVLTCAAWRICGELALSDCLQSGQEKKRPVRSACTTMLDPC